MVVGKLSDSEKIEKGMTYIVIVGVLGFVILAFTAYLHEDISGDIEGYDDISANENLDDSKQQMLAEISDFDLAGKLALKVATDWLRYAGIIVMIAAIIMFRVGKR